MTNRNFWARNLRDIILGGQDGLVNVLGIVLGVAVAINDTRLVLVAGLAATFAESFSMAAVAYTSMKAERDYLVRSHKDRGRGEDEVRQELADIALNTPETSALVVGLASVIGSFIPLLPFFWLPVHTAIPISLAASALTLFIVGAVKAKLTVGSWQKSGLEMMVIGMLAAFIGYLVGAFFQTP